MLGQRDLLGQCSAYPGDREVLPRAQLVDDGVTSRSVQHPCGRLVCWLCAAICRLWERLLPFPEPEEIPDGKPGTAIKHDVNLAGALHNAVRIVDSAALQPCRESQIALYPELITVYSATSVRTHISMI
jgi:hypothetical protein